MVSWLIRSIIQICSSSVLGSGTGNSTMVSRPKALGDWPIHKEGPANDVGGREVAPITGIIAIHGVVAHDHVMLRLDGVGSRAVRKKWRNRAGKTRKELSDNFIVYVTRVMAIAGRFLGLEGIDLFEMRRG